MHFRQSLYMNNNYLMLNRAYFPLPQEQRGS